MLISKPSPRWRRDVGIQDLIEHFNQKEDKWISAGKKFDLWESLSKKEIDVIVGETERCRNDFTYAARNYFWIIDKNSKQDKLFSLWESQELILDTVLRLRAQGRSQRIILVKARQLGASTVSEALIAHRAMFFRNSDCFVVSYDDDHAAYLFSIMQHIYDKMPWWLKPECWSRKFETGLIFDTPPDERRIRPGLNSKVTCKGATAVTGVGQGRALSCCHISEFADFYQPKAREIIEEDIENALADSPLTFGILESTAKGAGTYAHDLWLRMEKLGERANWYPLFLPWFFDKSRTHVVIPSSWEPQQQEKDIRDRATKDWVRCDNVACYQFYRSVFGDKEQEGRKCHFCGQGVFREFVISDNQLHWMEGRRINAEDDEESLNKLKQEMASTAEEAFRLSGIRLFSEKAISFAQSTLRDPIGYGNVTKSGQFHGVNRKTGKCFVDNCEVDHSHDGPFTEIWEMPEAGESYVIGADTADGLGGKHDYSVAQVLRLGRGGADVHVATFASNTTDAGTFAEIINLLGRFYNDALLAPELNATSGGVVAHALRVNLMYPNLYRPLNYGNVNLETSLFGWKTTAHSKNRLYQSMRRALDARLIYIRDKFTVTEIHNFRKEEESTTKMGAIAGHDDRIMALMIAYAAAHDRDWDEDGGMLVVRAPLTLETAPFRMVCIGACGSVYPAKTPKDFRRCPKCHSMHIIVQPNVSIPINEIPAIMPGDDEETEPQALVDGPEYIGL